MTIGGVITTRDVLRNAATIVRLFGAAAFLRCCGALITQRKTTFLACAVRMRR